MPKENTYRTAPSWLFTEQGATKLFTTQDEVDSAWEEGWFGPLERLKVAPLLSGEEWTKAELAKSIKEDPRYKGFKVNKKETVENIKMALVEFEVEHGLKETSLSPEED